MSDFVSRIAWLPIKFLVDEADEQARARARVDFVGDRWSANKFTALGTFYPPYPGSCRAGGRAGILHVSRGRCRDVIVASVRSNQLSESCETKFQYVGINK